MEDVAKVSLLKNLTHFFQSTVAKNLLDICNNAQKNLHFSGYGVILDSSHVYKTNGQYFVRMKIVDKSLNHADTEEGDR